jgi:hypothetical protein
MPAVSQNSLPCSPSVNGYATQQATAALTGVAKAYSLEATIKTELSLADGNTISGFTTARQARDSQGRTRIDVPSMCLWDQQQHPKWYGNVYLSDPVLKTTSTWTEGPGPSKKVGTTKHVLTVQMTTPLTERERYDEAKLAKQNTEELGKKTIAGLASTGMKITRIVPIEKEGNTLPLTYIEELWISDDYGVITMDRKIDPILGTTTYEVTKFSPGNPDVSLFRVPSDYQMTDVALAN